MDSASKQSSIVAESVIGTTPSTPGFRLLRDTRTTGSPQRPRSRSPERRNDRAAFSMVKGLNSYPKGIEMVWARDAALDVLLESVFCGVWTDNVLRSASLKKTFTLEERYEAGATDPYRRLKGCLADSMTISWRNGDAGQISFALRALVEQTQEAAMSGATYAVPTPGLDPSTPADITVTDLFGITAPRVMALNFTMTNNVRDQHAFGSQDPFGIGLGLYDIAGTVQLYFTSLAEYSTFAQAQSGLALNLLIGATTDQRDRLILPNCDVWNPDVDDPGASGDHMVTLNFMAKYDLTEGAAAKLLRKRAAEPPPTFLGLVATRTHFGEDKFPSNVEQLGSTFHYARDDLTAIRIVDRNGYITSFTETASGSTATIERLIEYPTNVFTRVLYSGVNIGTMASGAKIVSDSIAVSIPSGARFKLWYLRKAASGILASAAKPYQALGDRYAFGASGQMPAFSSIISVIDGVSVATVTDPNAIGVGNNDTTNYTYFPTAIIGLTYAKSVMGVGDSRTYGYIDTTADGSGDVGNIARSVGPYVGYTLGALSGATYTNFLASYAWRLDAMQYATSVIVELGFNDATNGRSLVQMQGDLTTLLAAIEAAWSGKAVFATTCEPDTSSSDGYATVANQTIRNTTQATVRVSYDNWIRTTPLTLAGYFDLSDAASSSRDSKKWKAPSMGGSYVVMTADGTHCLPAGYIYMGALPAIDYTQLE